MSSRSPSCNFDHQVAPLALVATFGWHNVDWWIWSSGGTVCKVGHQPGGTRLRNLDCHIAFWITLLAFGIISKGRVPKKGEVWYFAIPPSDPPSPYGLFSGKKTLTPIFFVENCIFNGRNEFQAWSHFRNH